MDPLGEFSYKLRHDDENYCRPVDVRKNAVSHTIYALRLTAVGHAEHAIMPSIQKLPTDRPTEQTIRKKNSKSKKKIKERIYVNYILERAKSLLLLS